MLTPRVRQLRPRLQPPPPAEAGMKGLLAPAGGALPVLRTQRLPSWPSSACPLARAWVRAGYCWLVDAGLQGCGSPKPLTKHCSTPKLLKSRQSSSRLPLCGKTARSDAACALVDAICRQGLRTGLGTLEGKPTVGEGKIMAAKTTTWNHPYLSVSVRPNLGGILCKDRCYGRNVIATRCCVPVDYW